MGIKAEAITKHYGDRTVVKDASVILEPASIVSLMGPNGAGKTTLFHIIAGLESQDSGSVFIDDVDVTGKPMFYRARCGMVYLPQESSIIRDMSVEDNLITIFQMIKTPKSEIKEGVEKLLERFKLTAVRKGLGRTLSGGERRRAEIARSLITNPKYLLLDEPFAGVAPVAVEEVQNIIFELKNDGMGILITDHSARELLGISDFVYFLNNGVISYFGNSRDVEEYSDVVENYLGKNFNRK